MEKFVPYEKLPKKKQREINRKKRKNWEVNPITKVVPDKHKEKRDRERERSLE